jgi:Pyruvate/2-oxoacid:ferredoxin oxidoreductase delta subunit
LILDGPLPVVGNDISIVPGPQSNPTWYVKYNFIAFQVPATPGVETAREKGLTADILNIAELQRGRIRSPDSETMLGFVSPTHGFNLPPIVMYFLFAFPRTRNRNPVFLVNTRAGMKFGPVFFPGLSGVALLLAACVLLLKGYRIVGMRPIDLPSNWISIHPSLRGKAVVAIHERCRNLTVRFAERILAGDTNFRSLYDIVQDLFIAPISLLYFLAGRFVFAKSFYASAACDNCDVCSRRCPVQAIISVRGRPFWTYRCESCMRCMNECPKRAIETGHGYIAGLMLFSSSVLADSCWTMFTGFVGYAAGGPLYWWIRLVWDTLLMLGLLTLLYRVIHLFSRTPVARQLLEYSSLTHYRIWGRYNLAKILRAEGRHGK